MLRRLEAKNFVHFQNGVSITFQSGANFFVGRCATGKSAALELIRRCHHDNVNVSIVSTTANVKEKAYAFCLYEDIEDFENGTIKAILAGIYVDPSDGDNVKEPKHIYKVAVVEYEDSKCTVYAKKIEFSTTNVVYYINFELSETDEKLRPNKIYDEVFLELIDIIKERKRCIDLNDNPSSSATVDKILEILLKQFASTMPHRGISSVMWTGQLVHGIKDKEKLCSDVTERADILKTLLNDNDNVDQNKAKQIYEKLCPEFFGFIMEENEIVVVDPSGIKVPLIRAPAGVIEAKQLSLLLAHSKVRTLCLEEPFRCMHQDMIKKLGQLILQRLEGKTIIIVSHEKALVSPWSLGRTHIFKKSMEKNSVIHEVIKFPDCCLKYGQNEEMKSVLFSSGVLLVEGVTDRIILQALFDQIVDEVKPDGLQYLLKHMTSRPEMKIDVIETIFARIDIVKLDGDKAGLDRQKFCKLIGVPCVLLLDRNAVLDKRSFPCIMKNLYVTEESNSGSVELESEDDWNSKYENISKCLGKKYIFVWKEGDIEDVLISQIGSENEIYSKMELGTIVREGKSWNNLKKVRNSWKSKLKSCNLGDVKELAISALGQNKEKSPFSMLIEFLLCKLSH